MGEFFLRPGISDDNNREYLPEKIKGSDIVVNENGNNSQPYPENLKQCHGNITGDGAEDEWYVYVPESYDPAKKTPLVISLHGGMMTGWGQCIYSSWTLAAEREISPEDPMKNHDVKLVLGLIELMKKDYNIDKGRIFMQGMSMGEMMTGLFARNLGHIFAGAAGSGSASFLTLLFSEDHKIINKSGPLAVWQSRPELNGIPDQKAAERKANKLNRLYWNRINECELLPEITIQGENNLAFYKGKKADMVYYDIKNRDHGQTFDDAALIWDYFFSGVRRTEDGTVICGKPVRARTGDRFAFAVTAGSKKAWYKNSVYTMSAEALNWKKMKYHGLEGGQLIRGEYHMVPVSFLAEVFGAGLNYENNCQVARMQMDDGRKLQFARGGIGCIMDNFLVQMYCEAVYRNEELYLSVEWFSEYVCGMHACVCL